MKHKIISAAVAAAVAFSTTGIAVFAEGDALIAPAPDSSAGKGIVILHVNDAHCGINADEETFGYADIAAYEAKLKSEGYTTLLVDAGDYVQGDVIGTLSDGEYIIDIMNELDFDVATLGNHEFDYGMEQFKKLTEKAEFDIVSSNFIDLKTNKPVFDGWTLVEANGVKLGFVGITTPETVVKSDPSNFKDANGEFIYSFCAGDNGEELYSSVQASVDAAEAAGADMIVALGHLGIDEQSSPWTSREVIENTSGIDLFIDGHSHSLIESELVTDEKGDKAVLTSAGTKLQSIGAVTITDGKITSDLVEKGEYTVNEDAASEENKAYQSASEFIGGIEEQYEKLVNTVVAKTDVDLTTMDPENPEKRIIRTRETNLGDLCADAYRTSMDADIAFVNGGGIRANIDSGDITYGEIIAVHPYGNSICLIEATGQEILDALELGACSYPGESGGFLQVSGLTYEIHSYIPSSVVLTENKEFVKVDGEYRVKNVLVNGKPLDPAKTYTLASHNYMLKSGGDGFTMFKDNKILKDEVLIDNQALINYIVDELGGSVGEAYKDPLGDGRITVVEKAEGSTENENPQTGDAGANVIILAAAALGAMVFSRRRK